jgi:tRNA nucleotidyltransferase/poly(A) polymerase
MAGEDENSYAGRWIARLRGRIIAQGGTPEQARRAAQSRFKETPEVVFMQPLYPLIFPPLLDSVRAVLPEGLTVYLVGGAVRDAFLGRATHDLDFSLAGEAIRTARRVADALSRIGTGNIIKIDFYPLDTERDTGRVILTDDKGIRMVMDFASFRGPDLESDLRGRDFTLNAIALNLSDNSLHDPLGGVSDLKEKRLRECSPSAFRNDPVRILRGVRLAAKFGFHILPETRKAMKEAAELLGNITPERLRDELFRIFDGPQPAACVRALDLLGALDKILPELTELKGVEQRPPHVHDVWEHTLAVVSHLEGLFSSLTPAYDPEKGDDLLNGLLVLQLGRYRQQLYENLNHPLASDRPLRGLLFLAALYHDVAKPACKQTDENGQLRFWGHDEQGAEIVSARARSLVLSNEEIQRLDTIIRNHMRVLFHVNRLLGDRKLPGRRAVYRFFRDTGPAGVDVCLLALADLRGSYEETLPQETWAASLEIVREFLENWYEKPAETITPPALLDGNDLMNELNLSAGKQVGDLLDVIREAQAVGEVSTRAQAMKLARAFLEDPESTKEAGGNNK